MSDDVAKTCGALEAGGEIAIHVAGFRQATESVRLRAWSAELHMQTGRYR